ncbi:hypothetical protein QQY66_06360 [Streptomyces sp. DG2A-72]|uniref:hypothetical protein n=1 Tax=Streptomyces sp. DG2A-72 TaxID=3051386 RepID=UPI00265BF067|nr:hypothetical protein [Streptomyces sp. DG2A-72]MDO0931322.1 hypothetical protein [Streptomyces sp. DG2A-72]
MTSPVYDAVYNIDGEIKSIPVIRWSEDGKPLVVDEATGQLVVAQSLPGFVQVQEDRYWRFRARSGRPETKSGRWSG